jgi:hypothetical protein
MKILANCRVREGEEKITLKPNMKASEHRKKFSRDGKEELTWTMDGGP